jgi:hypothetical protein
MSCLYGHVWVGRVHWHQSSYAVQVRAIKIEWKNCISSPPLRLSIITFCPSLCIYLHMIEAAYVIASYYDPSPRFPLMMCRYWRGASNGFVYNLHGDDWQFHRRLRFALLANTAVNTSDKYLHTSLLTQPLPPC